MFLLKTSSFFAMGNRAMRFKYMLQIFNSAVVAVLVAFVTSFLYARYQKNEDQEAATAAVKQIALYDSRLVSQVFLESEKHERQQNIIKLNICLDRLKAFPVETLKPPTLSEQVVDIEVASQIAIAFARGDIELSPQEQAEFVEKARRDQEIIDEISR